MKPASFLIPGLAGLALILVTACGGAAPAPTSTSAPPPPTTAPATIAPVTVAPVATTPPPSGNGGDTAEGEALFAGGSCASCHTIEGLTSGSIGPDLTHLGTDAASRKPGMSAEDYITESIRDPEAFVATGVERANPGIMTAAITAGFSDAEVDALVKFLLAQK